MAMADNLQLNLGSGGAKLATAETTISGDTAEVQMCGIGILSGSEGSWVYSDVVGGAGAVAAGVQRVTLALDDPAVVDLAAIEVLITAGNVDLAAMEALLITIDADTGAIKTAVELLDNAVSGAGFNVTQLAGAAVPIGAGVEATALRVTLATDSTGVVSIDDNGSSITVDGTVTANLSATDNAVLDAIAASVAGTLTVGSHAVTNAGTFAVQVDGAALTALQLIDDAVYADDADWTDGASKHVLVGGLYQSTPQSITDGDVGPIQLDANGRQLVKSLNYDLLVNGTLTAQNEVVTIAAANLGTSGVGISGTWVGTIVAEGDVGDGVWATIPMIHSLTGAAVASTTGNGNWFVGLAGFLNVRIRASEWTSGTATVYLEGTAAPAGVFLNRSIPTGGNTIGSVLLTAGANIVGQVGIDQTTPGTTNAVVDRPGTSGGLSMHKTISAASTNATNVKASAGQVYAVQVFNTNAAARYLKLYDDAAAPTVGTDTPVKTLTIPGNTAGAGLVLNWDKGLVFSSGIGFGLTTGIADNDTGAVAANEIGVNLDYK
jgi:hypothetical protein